MAKHKTIVKWDDIVIKPSNEEDLWESEWTVWYKKEDQIGTVSFAGEKTLGTIPIRVELVKRFQNRGYGTRVFKMMVAWAFGYKNIYEVTAVFERENDKCKNALEKAGFVYREKNGDLELYSITKPRTVWTGVYCVIGLLIGLILGIVIGNPAVGLVISMLVCLATGASMDAGADKARETVTGKKRKEEQNEKRAHRKEKPYETERQQGDE